MLIELNNQLNLIFSSPAHLDDIIVVQNAGNIGGILIEYFIYSNQVAEQRLVVRL